MGEKDIVFTEEENVLKTSNRNSAALQKEHTFNLIIDNAPNSAGSLTATAMDTYVSTETGGTWILAWGAGIGGGAKQKGSNITINGGIITASSNIGAGIGGGQQCRGFKITIENGFVTADSAFGAGIGGGGNGYGSDITIKKGTITADSSSGAGIGGGYLKNGNNIIISISLVSADSLFGDAIGGGSESSSPSSNITISGGSVKAAKLGCQPKNESNKDVYRFTIENPEKAKVTIRPKIDGEERQWNPVNHSSLDPDDTNLYVWLPKLENDSENNYYMIILQPEINSEHRRRNYSFDTDTKTFKTWQAVNDFDFKSPENTTYDGKPKEASLEFKFKPTSENNRTISLNYYEGNYNDINDSTQPLNTLPVNAGTYTVKAKIAASESYFAHNGLESPEWTFTIEKAPVAPGADFNKTTIFVPWSSKRISDITRPFSTDWKWDTDVEQELQVETTIKATAINKGADKGNYE